MLLSSGAIRLEQIAAFLLLATRFGALLLMAPPFGGGSIPASVRVVLVLTLSACLSPQVPLPSGGWSLGSLVPAFVLEGAIGVTMALGLNLAFAAFAVGGRILDTQIGFGIGQVLNPMTRQQAPVLTGIFGQLALVLFFCGNGQEGVLRGLVLGVQAYPPGGVWLPRSAYLPIVHQVSGLFALGFSIVAPVVFCLLLVEFSLGVVSRSLPQMNMFTMGIPVKIVVGLAALGAWAMAGPALLLRTQVTLFEGWEAMFR